MPDWDKYPLLKPYWSGFKKYKQLEEATKISQENNLKLSWLCRERRNLVRAGRKSNPIGCYSCDS
jgi:hypothetical protein